LAALPRQLVTRSNDGIYRITQSGTYSLQPNFTYSATISPYKWGYTNTGANSRSVDSGRLMDMTYGSSTPGYLVIIGTSSQPVQDCVLHNTLSYPIYVVWYSGGGVVRINNVTFNTNEGLAYPFQRGGMFVFSAFKLSNNNRGGTWSMVDGTLQTSHLSQWGPGIQELGVYQTWDQGNMNQ
jgi:hypothetical protein